jgi:hypothetical protein
MPSEPRVPTEPSLEELSAFIDNELDADAHAHVAEHVTGCHECQARLDGLRQTAHAIRALPMETPLRRFTLPEQRRPSWRWAPVGWIGSAAVALLLIAVGIQNLHLPAGTPTSGSPSTVSGGLAYAPVTHSQKGAVAPLSAPAASSQQLDSLARAAATNADTVVDSRTNSRRMILGADGASYSTSGRMSVSIQLQGSPSASANSSDQQLTLTLVRNGAGVALNPVGVISWNGTPIFGGTYDLGSLPLAGPGDYRLEATWVIPDGSGRVLQASVPIRITG